MSDGRWYVTIRRRDDEGMEYDQEWDLRPLGIGGALEAINHVLSEADPDEDRIVAIQEVRYERTAQVDSDE